MAKRKTSPTRSSGIYLRVTPEEHDELRALAAQADVDMAEALREGGKKYLLERTGQTPTDDPLLAEVRALAAKVESRFGKVKRRKE